MNVSYAWITIQILYYFYILFQIFCAFFLLPHVFYGDFFFSPLYIRTISIFLSINSINFTVFFIISPNLLSSSSNVPTEFALKKCLYIILIQFYLFINYFNMLN
ncbi:hypothetical protein CKR_2153 [Clostridium kluyveri NBRC 12016]|uniref:Uncharacterized protein n=1 Tax=Clostridium kluyveri (strain NBRC 12016) TaxID=583346 RepID=B9E3X9_CLOK1|nr:hypothetical protein CKR_2153 [Clostridium kluyveri NBRC 12016]